MAIQSPLGNRATSILDFIGNAFGMKDEEEKRRQAGAVVGAPIQQPSLKVGPMQFGEPQNMEQLQVQQQMQEQNARMMQPPTPMQKPQVSTPEQIQGKIAETATKQLAAGGDKDPGFMQKVSDYFGDESNMLRLAMAFNTMRLNPDQQLAAYAAKRLESIQAQKSTQSAAQGIARQLAEMGYKEHAQAALSNPALAKDIYNAVVKSQLDTGAKSTIGKLQADLSAGRITQEQYDSEVNRLKDSGKTEIIMGEGDSWNKGANEQIIKQFSTLSEGGLQAQRSMREIAYLEDALSRAPSGGMAALTNALGSIGIKLEGASAVEAANAIISRLVPAQRPPGSGTMSDADLRLFQASLPSLMNTAEGNQMIIKTLKDIAMYDMKMGEIANRAMMDPKYSPQQAREDMMKLANPLEWIQTADIPKTESTAPGVKKTFKYDINGNPI